MLYKVLIAGLMATCLSIYFKEQKNIIGFAIVLASSLLIVFFSLSYFSGVIKNLNIIFEGFDGEGEYLSLLLKMLGITYICDLTAGICRDSGNTSIAHQMTTFGKLVILSMGLPVISSLFEIITELL